ncbi:MAG: zinc ribbon domain-containing protein [Chloroflexia bacterium]|nr:zinc ribbon domain-containing protein [Chloroflexia bacterium]
MPVYVYRCEQCGKEFEKLFLSARQSEGEVRCPNCESEQVERRPALFGLGGGLSPRGDACATPSSGGG